MLLLGQMLASADFCFVEARGKHSPNDIKDVEIVVVDENDKKKCEAWCRFHKLEGAVVRLATSEELERYQRLQEEMGW